MSSPACDRRVLRPQPVEALGLASGRGGKCGGSSVGALGHRLKKPSPGQVCYNVGRVELAKTTLRKALSLLGREFPGTSAGAFFQLLLEQSAHASRQKSRGSCPPAEAG